jgi:hypothetical protein
MRLPSGSLTGWWRHGGRLDRLPGGDNRPEDDGRGSGDGLDLGSADGTSEDPDYGEHAIGDSLVITQYDQERSIWTNLQ